MWTYEYLFFNHSLICTRTTILPQQQQQIDAHLELFYHKKIRLYCQCRIYYIKWIWAPNGWTAYRARGWRATKHYKICFVVNWFDELTTKTTTTKATEKKAHQEQKSKSATAVLIESLKLDSWITDNVSKQAVLI